VYVECTKLVNVNVNVDVNKISNLGTRKATNQIRMTGWQSGNTSLAHLEPRCIHKISCPACWHAQVIKLRMLTTPVSFL
jgi:hypothetical protein